jgi:hypothetical protein
MKNYTINLKGTKSKGTKDLKVNINCDNKSQAFYLAYSFFQKAETDIVYGKKETGLATIHKWLPNADDLKQYAGKYIVYKTSISINK